MQILCLSEYSQKLLPKDVFALIASHAKTKTNGYLSECLQSLSLQKKITGLNRELPWKQEI